MTHMTRGDLLDAKVENAIEAKGPYADACLQAFLEAQAALNKVTAAFDAATKAGVISVDDSKWVGEFAKDYIGQMQDHPMLEVHRAVDPLLLAEYLQWEC